MSRISADWRKTGRALGAVLIIITLVQLVGFFIAFTQAVHSFWSDDRWRSHEFWSWVWHHYTDTHLFSVGITVGLIAFISLLILLWQLVGFPTLRLSHQDAQRLIQIDTSPQQGVPADVYHQLQASVVRVYNVIIGQFTLTFYASLIFAVIAFCIIVYVLLLRPTWPAAALSLLLEAVPALFFTLSDRARKQIDAAFVGLRRDSEVSRANDLLNSLKDDERREQLKEHVILQTYR